MSIPSTDKGPALLFGSLLIELSEKELNMRLLLIDDNKDLIEGLQVILETEDYDVDYSHDYDSAITLLEKNQYDILFIDAKLPEKNGFDIFYHYRNLGGKGKVVIMSAFRCEQLIDHLISPTNINIIHEPNEIEFQGCSADTTVQIVISERCKELVHQLSISGDDNYVVIDTDVVPVESNENTHFVIHTPLEVMENILLMYILHQTHLARHYTLLVDSSQHKYPLKEFLSCGCLLKPFEPDDMLDIVKQIDLLPATLDLRI